MKNKSHNLLLSRTFQYLGIMLIVVAMGGGYWYWKQARAAQTITDNRPSFEAPLTTGLDLAAGQGIATYSRADGADRRATVTDFEGRIIPVKSDEARFEGARRVENLATYSEDLSNVIWGSYCSSTTRTAGIVDPYGGTSAWRLDTGDGCAANYGGIFRTSGAVAGVTYRVSAWLRVSSGTVSVELGLDDSKFVSVTLDTTWRRYSYIGTTGVNLRIFELRENTASSPAIYIYHPQVEDVTGQTNQNPSEYVSTNVKTAFPYHGAGVDGVKYFDTQNGNTVASNVVTEAVGTAIPSASLHGYLVEGARTNKLTYSEQFGSWTSEDGSISADVAVAPDGQSTADKFVSNTNTAQHRVKQTASLTAGTTYTGTVYVKKAGYDYHMKIWSAPGSATMSVNLDTGAVINTGGSEYVGSSVTSLPNGWYRVSLTMTTVSGGTYTQMNYLYNNSESFTGDGTSGIYLWGAQLESGNFASSYIPTTSAAVTRAKDSLSYPSSENTEATQGTAVSEIYGSNKDFSTVFDRILSIDDGAANTNTVTLLFNGNVGSDQGRAYSGGSSGGVTQTAVGATAGTKLTSPALLKVGTSWIAGRHTFFDSGVLRDTKTGFTAPVTFTDIHIGTSSTLGTPAYGSIKNVRVWKKALSDAELQNLTSTVDAIAASAVEETTVKAPDNIDLVGYWSFDEGSGTTTGDFSPAGASLGTLANGPTWVDGKSGKALSFDGTDDYVSAADSAVLDTGSLTASMWFTLTIDPLCDANNNWRSLIRKGGTASTTNGWDVVLEQGKNFNFDIGLGATSRLATSAFLQVGVPIYLTFTYDAASGVQQVWADGVLKATKVNTPTAIVANASPIEIAHGANAVACPNGNGYAPGVYDDVRIYGRALTASEIVGLYRQSESAHTTVNVSQNDQLTTGLVGLWSFDGSDLSGTTAYDRSGQGNNGTLTNNPTVYPGKVGQALSFDGTSSYISVPYAAIFAPGGSQWTVSAWVRTSNDGTILCESANGSSACDFTADHYGLRIVSGHAAFSFSNGDFINIATGTSVVSDGKWHFIVGTRSASKTANIYVDGVLETTFTGTGVNGGIEVSIPLYIGSDDTAVSDGLNGSIDEVRIYNRALSVPEISALYNLGR